MCETKVNKILKLYYISEWEDTVVKIQFVQIRFEAIPNRITMWVFVVAVVRFTFVLWV